MSVQPTVSIITALYNRLDLTRTYLDALEATMGEVPHEIILVDDGSTDGTREFLHSMQSSNLKVILNEKNLGFAGANNVGARRASAPVLAFLNNDLLLTPGWLQPMLSLLNEEKAGFVGNVQCNAHSGRIDHAGIIFTPWGIPEHFGMDYLFFPKKGFRAFQAVTAACCLVKRTVFEEAEGFDPLYRNGFEDIDLCLRMGENGRRHYVSYESRVGHWVSSSPGRKQWDDPNRALFLQRWGAMAAEWGKRDWPRHYLRRHFRKPWKLNARKTVDAVSRLIVPQRKPSKWMQAK